MALTPEQIERIASSYQLVEPRLDELVALFYSNLFQAAPQVRSMFPDDMENQKKHLSASLKLVAQNINKLESLEGALNEMGARHVGYGAQEEQYPVVRDTLVSSMAEIAGYTWTQSIADAWIEALNVVAGYMIDGQRSAVSKAA